MLTTHTDAQSGNASGSSGNSRQEYSLVTKPIDGLTLHYNKVNDYEDGIDTEDQLEEGGSTLSFRRNNWLW